MLSYCVRLSHTFVSRREFRHEVLRLLVKIYHVKSPILGGSKRTDLILTVFLFPFLLWNSWFGEYGERREGITAKKIPLIPDVSLTNNLICCDNE